MDYRLMNNLRRKIQELRYNCEKDLNASHVAAFKLSMEAGDDPKDFQEELERMQRSVDAFKAFFDVFDEILEIEDLKLSKIDRILDAVEKK